MASFEPNGYDRATGQGSLPGTPTPIGVILTKNGTGAFFFEELPDSPTIERGEQTTIVHTVACDPTTGQIVIEGTQRGQILIDSQGNWSKILSATFQYQKGDHCIVSITCEGFGGVSFGGGVSAFDVPPDEFGVETLEFNPSIYRHPRYDDVLNYNDTTMTPPVTGQRIIQWIQSAVNAPNISGQTDNATLLNSTNITDSGVLALALELLGKVRQGEETFYLAGFKVTYSAFFFLPVALNPGGYIEDPVASGALPYYFWSLDGSSSNSDSNNCFLAVAEQVAPQFYQDGISWLRQSDSIVYQRTFFKRTSIWIGGPAGNWDAEIYSPTS